MPLRSHEVDCFEASRARLGAIAYRLLGSADEAEDAVQETFLRWEAADRERIRVPEAWLTKALTNLCLTQLTSARAKRETYVGQWLPEPLLDDDPMLGPAESAEQRESVSVAVLRLMERLSPVERAVYVLREAFGHTHREVAGILDISEAASQQYAHRAKHHLTDRPRTVVDPAAAREVIDEFLTAAVTGETEPLVRLLTNDAIGVGDGGGRIPANAKVVSGALAVAKLLRGLFKPSGNKRDMVGGRPALYTADANGAPALVAVVGERVVAVLSFAITTEGIVGVWSQGNPDKLERVGRRWAERDRGEPLLTMW